MSDKMGFEGKLYYNAAGTENPVVPGNWTELTNVTDVTTSLEKAKADSTTRANNGWRTSKTGLKDANIEFEMVWDPEDAGFSVLQAAFMAGDQVGIAALDGDIETAGIQGLVSAMEVITFSRSEALEDVMKASVTLAPARNAVAPYWHTVST